MQSARGSQKSSKRPLRMRSLRCRPAEADRRTGPWIEHRRRGPCGVHELDDRPGPRMALATSHRCCDGEVLNEIFADDAAAPEQQGGRLESTRELDNVVAPRLTRVLAESGARDGPSTSEHGATNIRTLGWSRRVREVDAIARATTSYPGPRADSPVGDPRREGLGAAAGVAAHGSIRHSRRSASVRDLASAATSPDGRGSCSTTEPDSNAEPRLTRARLDAYRAPCGGGPGVQSTAPLVTAVI